MRITILCEAHSQKNKLMCDIFLLVLCTRQISFSSQLEEHQDNRKCSCAKTNRSRSYVMRKESCRAGTMLMKANSSGAEVVSFLRRFCSPGLKWELQLLLFNCE